VTSAGGVSCPHCGHDTPAFDFCCRCGFPLAVEHGDVAGGPNRRQYAASPEEPAWGLRLTSTLFPQLPRTDMTAFRVALVSGLGLIVALGFAGLYPVALTAAAVLLPLLMVLYLYDVDVYEDEPLLVVGLTMLSGLLCGVAFGVALQHISLPVQRHGWSHLTEGAVVVRTFAVPIVTVVVAMLGPLVLLRHPRFNDVLDGVIFGVASAVTLTCSMMLIAAWPITEAGLQPNQDAAAWTQRLVEVGIFVPIIAAGAVGWAAAALWLRYRAPVADRRALGGLGTPAPAGLVALILVVAAALVQQIFGSLARFAALAVLAAVALTLVRRAIHVGLFDEADEAEPGPPVTCANCGRSTPLHTFCSRCGVALRALPKALPTQPAPPS